MTTPAEPPPARTHRPAGTTLAVSSPAKINWYLRVLGRRPDGYHDIDTVMQTLDWEDRLSFEPIAAARCELNGFPDDIAAETNMIARAWEVLSGFHHGCLPGVRVSAVKNLPRGGGLGGGSSNAAVTLTSLDSLFGLSTPTVNLEHMAAELGSDVPFFLSGGCARAGGRGEFVSPIEGALHEFHLVLVTPLESMPTAMAYRELARSRGRNLPETSSPDAVIAALLSGDVEGLGAAIVNDFEPVAAAFPWYRNASQALLSAGCVRAFLCGSGSTVAGLIPKGRNARQVATDVYAYCLMPVHTTIATSRPSGRVSRNIA